MERATHARDATSLPDRAIENLRYIRDTMDRAASFTAVSGWGHALAGVSALVAVWISADRSAGPWLTVWLIEAAVGLGLTTGLSVRKARLAGAPVTRGAGRKFLLGFAPPALAAMALTPALVAAGAEEMVAGMWLLLYGTATTTAGMFSVRAVPAMGVALMLVGGLALAFPALRDVWLALGFGALHIGFGLWIARKHGG